MLTSPKLYNGLFDLEMEVKIEISIKGHDVYQFLDFLGHWSQK